MSEPSKTALRVAVVLGTRPEAIKLAPVVLEMRRRPGFDCRVVLTAQHREMVDNVLSDFGIAPDVDLNLMRPGQSLPSLTARILEAISPVLAEMAPDLLMVQGDTTTTFTAALAAFYQKIPVAHVEAGLRTGNPRYPFPEEVNRRLTTHIASRHYAPTAGARQNLLNEGIPGKDIVVTGNTVIDALLEMNRRFPASPREGHRQLLVTSHRRENLGENLRDICRAVLTLAERFPDLTVQFPVHLNPAVREVVHQILAGHPRIRLLPPQGYREFCRLLSESYLVLTDSGGIQEEAPSLGKPVLVLRRETERQEAVAAGTALLVGTREADIVAAAAALLEDEKAYRRMASAKNPFGDGQASAKMVDDIQKWFVPDLGDRGQ
ncbi:MAG: UDP-N-acetylglucosamine 2-epimerase (non-hydrolyzing) [Calditrichaeota bacterium]|nr:UDP-N-acetylglucosamine 2-epimerase (non-hydrolyzing) [Calditrichota bacterium]